jgi:hypothetical protein
MPLSVAHSIPEEFRREFTNNLEHEVQQLLSKFSSRIKVEGFEGKENVYNSLEKRTFKSRVGRLQQSAPTEAELHARKLTKVPFYDQAIFDKWDKEFLGKLALPDSETIQAMKAAYARLIDEEVCKAADATVYGGQEPYITAIDLDDAQKVDVQLGYSGQSAANVGLTPQKLIAAMKIFKENDIYPEEEELILAINPAAEQDLYDYIRTAGNDVWANMIAKWAESGGTTKLFGFTVVCTNRILRNQTIGANNTGIDKCFAYSAKRGIYMAPEKLEIHMDVLPTQQHALQLSAYATLGFMRRFEKGVVMIPCDRNG